MKCPICDKEMKLCEIGNYCPNADCPVLDDALLWSRNESGDPVKENSPVKMALNMKEEIEWFDIKEKQPDDKKDKDPLLVQRHGSFKFGIWHRLSYHENPDDQGSQRLYRWDINPDIRYWARIKGYE